MIWTRGTLLMSLSFLVAPAFAAPVCLDVFKPEASQLEREVQDFAANHIQTENPRLLRLLKLIKGGLASRFVSDPDFTALTEKLRTTDIEGRYSYSGPQPTYFGMTMTLQKFVQGNRIVYSLPSVFMTDAHGKQLSANSKPAGLDLAFPKLFTAIMVSASREMAANPELRHVEIIAGTVLNERLVGLLKELGFEKRPSVDTSEFQRTYDYDMGPMDSMNGFGGFSPPRWSMRRGGSAPVTGRWDQTHTDYAKTWDMDFALVP